MRFVLLILGTCLLLVPKNTPDAEDIALEVLLCPFLIGLMIMALIVIMRAAHIKFKP